MSEHRITSDLSMDLKVIITVFIGIWAFMPREPTVNITVAEALECSQEVSE